MREVVRTRSKFRCPCFTEQHAAKGSEALDEGALRANEVGDINPRAGPCDRHALHLQKVFDHNGYTCKRPWIIAVRESSIDRARRRQGAVLVQVHESAELFVLIPHRMNERLSCLKR
jgi:hypothetical protein